MQKVRMALPLALLLSGCSYEGVQDFMRDWRDQKEEAEAAGDPVPYDPASPDDPQLNDSPAVEEKD
ncbi:MAG: hypothetical protein KDH19_21130 [Geminicoccaceae bacterium]|nr:hypothetical protein [Geminicoccaceae bacterium]MCB2011801.1 hypothetical protein [Geminicoccaceae bacterium]